MKNIKYLYKIRFKTLRILSLLQFVLFMLLGQRGMSHEVSLNTKHGVEAKNYEGIGEAAKLKPIEVELRRLEDLSNDIVQDFSIMRKREEEMRDTNGKLLLKLIKFF